LLSQNGYQVQDLPVTIPANREALSRLGYMSVPVVVVAGRAFPGFPERHLEQSLGLASARFSAPATRRMLLLTLADLETIAQLLAELPDAMWREQAYPLIPDRDHTFGHFAWGIFRFLELTLAAPRLGALRWDDLQESVQVGDWRSADRFRGFRDVQSYAEPLLASARDWAQGLERGQLRQPLSTPWGGLELHSLIGILAEHTTIKRDHLRRRLAVIPTDDA
jgi:hypothetical protein